MNFEQEEPFVSTPKIVPFPPAFTKQKAKFVSDHQLDLKIGKMSSEMQAPERQPIEEMRSNT